MKRWGFDFFGTLTHPNAEPIRALARELFAQGDEIHIVSAISPGLPMDYAGMLKELNVPFTAVHRCDHVPAEKVAILKALKCAGFWDDTKENVNAARMAGIPSNLAGVDHPRVLRP